MWVMKKILIILAVLVLISVAFLKLPVAEVWFCDDEGCFPAMVSLSDFIFKYHCPFNCCLRIGDIRSSIPIQYKEV